MMEFIVGYIFGAITEESLKNERKGGLCDTVVSRKYDRIFDLLIEEKEEKENINERKIGQATQ